MVTWSSVEAEYRVMAHTTCEMLWVNILYRNWDFLTDKPWKMFCDYQDVMYIDIYLGSSLGEVLQLLYIRKEIL